MASNSSGGGDWPIPNFAFRVNWEDAEMQFQEISGLDAETQEIEYRAGDSPAFSVQKMPGLKKFGDLTMKKGVFRGDNKFWDWFTEIKLKRRPLTISLLDEAGAAVMVWTLSNAWPSKISGTDLKASGNEVAIEALVISHEGLSLVK